MMYDTPKTEKTVSTPDGNIAKSSFVARHVVAATALIAAATFCNPLLAGEVGNPNWTDTFTGTDRGWSEWQLVDFHGRPKFIIGADRRAGRNTTREPDTSGHFAETATGMVNK